MYIVHIPVLLGMNTHFVHICRTFFYIPYFKTNIRTTSTNIMTSHYIDHCNTRRTSNSVVFSAKHIFGKIFKIILNWQIFHRQKINRKIVVSVYSSRWSQKFASKMWKLPLATKLGYWIHTHPFKTIETSLVNVFWNVGNTEYLSRQHHDIKTHF
jgi:hypothetical protein